VVRLSRPHPSSKITIRSRQRTGSRHRAVVDGAPVAREEVGEVDTAEKEVGEDTVEGGLTEIVVAGAVSDSPEYSPIWKLTCDHLSSPW